VQRLEEALHAKPSGMQLLQTPGDWFEGLGLSRSQKRVFRLAGEERQLELSAHGPPEKLRLNAWAHLPLSFASGFSHLPEQQSEPLEQVTLMP